MNDAVEATIMDALKCALDDVDENETQETYLLTQNVIIDVEKGGRIHAFISRFAARALTQENVLDSLGNRLSETFLDKDEIISFLVQRLQKKA